jgi:hypothetical protein
MTVRESKQRTLRAEVEPRRKDGPDPCTYAGQGLERSVTSDPGQRHGKADEAG